MPVRPVRFLWENTTPWQVHLTWWVAEIADDAEPVPNPDEVAAIRWMAIDELESAEALLESNRPFLGRLRALVEEKWRATPPQNPLPQTPTSSSPPTLHWPSSRQPGWRTRRRRDRSAWLPPAPWRRNSPYDT